MTNLIVATRVIDPDDPTFGFLVPQLECLAKRVAHLSVVADEVRRVPRSLNAEVISLGTESGVGKFRRGLRYVDIVRDLVRRQRPHALIAHGRPVYLDLVAPLIRAYGVAPLLWYVHESQGAPLRIAEHLAEAVLTAIPESYPGPSEKVRVTGHAIDTHRFVRTPSPPRSNGVQLLSMGPTSPDKRYPDLLAGVAKARRRGVDARLRIVGSSTDDGEIEHRRELLALVNSLSLAGAVSLELGRPSSEVPKLMSQAHAIVSGQASAGKAVFEAMACGRPVLTPRQSSAGLSSGTALELEFDVGDAEGLADRICSLAFAFGDELEAVGSELRSRVEKEHSLEHWADRVVAVSEELGGRNLFGLWGREALR